MGIPLLEESATGFLTKLEQLEETIRSNARDLPLKQKVVAAFLDMPASETELKMLNAILGNPDSTSGELSKVCRWEGQSWHMHFGDMCRRRAYLLGSAPPSAQDGITPQWSQILCDIRKDDEKDETWRWRLKPQAVEGLLALCSRDLLETKDNGHAGV